jgi:dihydrodipicolinate synthase/N-acetylneuraminate lyase
MIESSRYNFSPIESQIRPRVKRGLSIPSITIFDADGKILEEDQRKLFRHNAQAGKGADIIFGVGTTGEFNRMPNTDRQRLIAILADEVHKINQDLSEGSRNPVEGWAGVTAETKSLTLDNIACAMDSRADAVVIAPLSIHLNRASSPGFFRNRMSNWKTILHFRIRTTIWHHFIRVDDTQVS